VTPGVQTGVRMDDAHDAEPEQSPYVRLPWGVVAAGLAGVLLIALAAGLFANRYLRPQVGVVPTPIAIAAVPASPTPSTPVPTVAPTPAATPLVVAMTETRPTVSAPTGTAVPATAASALLSATPTTLAILPSATPTTVATPRETLSADLVAEIDAAYQHYWQIRAEALFDLDSSRLSEVMTGEHLAAIAKLIDELRAEGHALLTEIDHRYVIVSASANDAAIADTYTDSTVYVDSTTHEALSQPANDKLQEQYQLTRIDGSWRVVSLVRVS